MQDGDIFEVREEHLEQAIQNKEAKSWRVCEECLVSVAAADHYNDQIREMLPTTLTVGKEYA